MGSRYPAWAPISDIPGQRLPETPHPWAETPQSQPQDISQAKIDTPTPNPRSPRLSLDRNSLPTKSVREKNPKTFPDVQSMEPTVARSGAHQIVLILEGEVELRDPTLVPIHQHVPLFTEARHLWDTRS